MKSKDQFLKQHDAKLTEFVRMSRDIGSRSDFVQGGGGNTSVKLDGQLMAIKASGFRLEQIDMANAYAVLDYAKIRHFYAANAPEDLADIEKAGAENTRSALYSIEGIKDLRPSVEAGFHAVLDGFVLHSHSVYANLAACSREGQEVAAQALDKLPAQHIFIPYVNPGAQLTFVVARARRQAADEDGRQPDIIFMHNHGLIITGPDAQYCLDLHEQVNNRLMQAYNLNLSDWPQIRLADGNDKITYRSDTAWLRERLQKSHWQLENFTDDALYPDQLVFLGRQLRAADNEELAKEILADKNQNIQAVIIRNSGAVLYKCGFIAARTIEETLCAVLFIRETLAREKHNLVCMSKTAKGFISNWESEKYRREIAAD